MVTNIFKCSAYTKFHDEMTFVLFCENKSVLQKYILNLMLVTEFFFTEHHECCFVTELYKYVE